MITSAYIHIPFCKTICSYCDFCKYYYRKEQIIPYLDSLKKEIKERYQGEVLKTIYVGGGTPSSLSLEELTHLLEILSIFSKEDNYEYTVECNIENITEEKVSLLAKFGVNRISLGVQTFQEKYLHFLNRKHTKQEVFTKIQMIKKYIANINVDLIYAIPGETIEDLEDDLNCLLQLDIPHISTYSLMIEEHTLLYNQKVENISEELDAKMYEYIGRKLKGYNHYEISNFARPEFESKHNLTYWNNLEYYGFGLGASGYIGDIRYTNTRSLEQYQKGKREYQKEKLSLKEKMENEFILGFRKKEGVSLSSFEKKYHKNPLQWDFVQKLLQQGLLQNQKGNLMIPERYFYISNDILLQFLDVAEMIEG